jgi:SAM-dependent methyltransferase
MREVAEPHRNVRFIEGMAEETGAPAAAYDLVTAFQAFHWFATDAVLQEIVRVVRPGGRAALVLNERDESDPFTAAFGAIVRRYATDDTEALRAKSLEVFRHLPGTLAEHEFPNSQQLDRSGLLRRVGSTSYLPHTGDAAEALRADVDALFAANISDGFVRMVLRTIVVRIDLPR